MITWLNWTSPSTRCPLASVTLAIALNGFSMVGLNASSGLLGLASGIEFNSRSELASRLATCSLLSNMLFSTLENWLLEPLACMWVTTDVDGWAPEVGLVAAPLLVLLLLISSLALGCGGESDFLRASFRNRPPRAPKPPRLLGFLKPLNRPLLCTPWSSLRWFNGWIELSSVDSLIV